MTHSARRDRICLPILAILFVLLFLVGCESLQGPQPVDSDPGAAVGNLGPASPADLELTQLLEEKSGGLGLDFFRFPQSYQFDKIPQDPQNPLTSEKVKLGKLLLHETALGVNNVRPEGRETYACASCHIRPGRFSSNLPQGIGEGGTGFGIDGEGRTFLPQYDSNPDDPDCQPIKVPSFLNGAYQQLMLWSGAFGGVGDNIGTEDKWVLGTPLDSNWLGMQGLESQAHGGLRFHRMEDIESSRVATIPQYQELFAEAFPGDPDPINRLNAALAIAAFERTVLANRAPFQAWLRGNRKAMSERQKRGAVLFFGEANCVTCHTGPALTSMTFNALGMNDLDGSYDIGRVNLNPFGGTVPEDVRRGRGGFTGRPEDNYKFKTPQLYNLKDGPFYGHGSSFSSVRQVVEYKNAAVAENPIVPASQLAPEFQPLGLTGTEIDDLIAFLEDALYDPRLDRYAPNRLPSGNCFPVNDPQAQEDLDCDRHPNPREFARRK